MDLVTCLGDLAPRIIVHMHTVAESRLHDSYGEAPVHCERKILTANVDEKVAPSTFDLENAVDENDDSTKMVGSPQLMSRYLNVKTAKSVAFALVLAFFLCHGIFHLRYGA